MPSINLTKVPQPIAEIENNIHLHQTEVEEWLSQELQRQQPLFYCSVDLRNAGYKIAPVDTNLFPAGFNNLGPDFLPSCVQAALSTMRQICPTIKKIILVPEDHTRNLYYYENVAIISKILREAGFEVRVGSLLPDLKEPRTIKLPSGGDICLEPLERSSDQVAINGFSSCIILLNNDLSAGIPEVLRGLKQIILPPLSAGWHSRLKSHHFKHYRNVAREFSDKFAFDPWFISPLFRYCGEINFMAKGGERCLVEHAKDLLDEIHQKYNQFNIQQKPFLAVKADAGTYGMAVMMIQEPEELLQLNRKERTRMSTIKGGRDVHKVILQEGIYTVETVGKSPSFAEPVIYMIGEEIVGGFYRIHSGKSHNENLNAPGMTFEPLTITDIYKAKTKTTISHSPSYLYTVIARLALIAAAREIKAYDSQEVNGDDK